MNLFFSISGRINRTRYLLGLVVLILLVAILSKIVETPAFGKNTLVTASSIFYALVLFWIMLSLVFKRLHDLGKPGWLIFIPFVNIWWKIMMIFAEGQTGLNKYDDHTDNNTKN